MGKLFEYACAECGRPFGRRADAEEHLSNPRIHNGIGTVTSFTEYVIGVIQGRYRPPSYNNASQGISSVREGSSGLLWQPPLVRPQSDSHGGRAPKGKTKTFLDDIHKWADFVRDFKEVTEFMKPMPVDSARISWPDPILQRQYYEIQAQIRKFLQEKVLKELKEENTMDYNDIWNINDQEEWVNYNLLEKRQIPDSHNGVAPIVATTSSIGASSILKPEKKENKGKEGKYVLYRHEPEAANPVHWVLYLKGKIKGGHPWIKYLKFSEEPFIATTNGDVEQSIPSQGLGDGKQAKSSSGLRIEAHLLMAWSKENQNESFNDKYDSWMNKCCTYSTHQILEQGTFFESPFLGGRKNNLPFARSELYFEGSKLAGRYLLSISDIPKGIWQFTRLFG